MAAAVFTIAPEVIEALGLTIGFLCTIGVVKKVGEEIKVDSAVNDFIKKEEKNSCCCGLGPSGKYKVHFIMKANRKEAEEAALHYGKANGVLYHPSNTKDRYPHFHPTRNGKKISGVHFQFPG